MDDIHSKNTRRMAPHNLAVWGGQDDGHNNDVVANAITVFVAPQGLTSCQGPKRGEGAQGCRFESLQQYCMMVVGIPVILLTENCLDLFVLRVRNKLK